jgi:hypothetical protein
MWKRFLPTKENLLKPRACHKCGQWMSEELLKERQARRAKNISASVKGRPKLSPEQVKVRYEKIWCLRDMGLTYGQIQIRLNVSRSSVISALRSPARKQMELQNKTKGE